MRKWKILIGGGVCIAACVAAFAGVQAQRDSPPVSKLTADDREEIRGLLHRYVFALDNCTDAASGTAYADLFTEDGRFGSGNNLDRRGREALTRVITEPDGTCRQGRQPGPGNQVHFFIQELIEPSPEGARGVSYLFQIDGPGGQPYWNGWFEDVYVKTPRGWRFKSRIHVNNERAGVPPAALQRRREIAAASQTMTADASIPISRNPIRWLDGADNRALEDTPSYAPGVGGRAHGPTPAGGQQGR